MNTGGSYYIKNFCGSFGNYCQIYFMGVCDYKILYSETETVSVAPALCSDRSTWSSMISQAVAIYFLIFCKLKEHA